MHYLLIAVLILSKQYSLMQVCFILLQRLIVGLHIDCMDRFSAQYCGHIGTVKGYIMQSAYI